MQDARCKKYHEIDIIDAVFAPPKKEIHCQTDNEEARGAVSK
jgi:hypothetical protein